MRHGWCAVSSRTDHSDEADRSDVGARSGNRAPPAEETRAERRRRRVRRRRARRLLLALAVLLAAAVGVFGYLWVHTGARPLAMSVAIERFRHQPGGQHAAGWGPAPGVYLYRGSGTEEISLPPKTQSEGPGIPGTVTERPGRCFEFRLDYSDDHWQDWVYCLRDGDLVTASRAGYYLWDFVAFSVDDTSTYTCTPAAVTIPSRLVRGDRYPETCTGTNNHLATGLVRMRGGSTVLGTATLRIGRRQVTAVEVREVVEFSGGQHGSNDATTWFSLDSGLPVRGVWRTVVSTPSPFGTSTLHAHGEFSLSSTTPER